ncbi:hypothetical protein [uncultured Bartonella sp.]|uniref:hypothetical protein n=1 Tax=uncultured Bartonella sp. TaxID=104108 RepID=UPI0025E577CC|nr:hypothetical protein [uncultured Bartonella sp.]
MLRAVAQAILECAGFITALFVPEDATNFDFVRMGVALVMLLFFIMICWLIPQLFHHDKRSS